MAYTNELSYLLEDDDKSIEPVHAVYLVSPIDAHIEYYYYLFTQYLSNHGSSRRKKKPLGYY